MLIYIDIRKLNTREILCVDRTTKIPRWNTVHTIYTADNYFLFLQVGNQEKDAFCMKSLTNPLKAK